MGLIDLGHEADPVLTRVVEEDKVRWWRKRNLRLLYLLLYPTCMGIEITSGFDSQMINGLQFIPLWNKCKWSTSQSMLRSNFDNCRLRHLVTCERQARVECDRLSTGYHQRMLQPRRNSGCANCSMGRPESWPQMVNLHWQLFPVRRSCPSRLLSEQ